MSVVEELGDALARDVIAAMDQLKDDRLFDKLAKVVGDGSPTLLEAFTTAYRVRIAEKRSRKWLEAALAAGQAAEPR